MKSPEVLESELRAKVAAVRADDSLNWENKMKTIRRLWVRYDKDRREAEEKDV